MSKSASWHAPMSTSARKRRNRNIAIAAAVVVIVLIASLTAILTRSGDDTTEAATTQAASQQDEPQFDTAQVSALLDSLAAEDFLEVEGEVEMAHIGKHLAVGGYRKSDETVVGTIRGGGAAVSFTDTGAEVFLRTNEAGWALLGVDGTKEMWARTERGTVIDPLIMMPMSAVVESTSGDFRATSPTSREYANGTKLSVEEGRLIFVDDGGRRFSYGPPQPRTSVGIENYIIAATKSQAEILQDGDRTWLKVPEGYVPD